MTAHAQLIFEKLLAFVLSGSFNVFVVNFLVCPPRDPACPFVSKYLSPIHTTYQSGIVGQRGEQGQQSKKR